MNSQIQIKRKKKAKLNIALSFISQIISVICGLVVPRVMLLAFGSEANGAVSSITQFLSYIAILEGGVGGVARAALYKPLSAGDKQVINAVFGEIQHFFRNVALVFIAYVAVLSVFFKDISHIEYFDRLSTVILVFVIGITTFAQYFFGISNSILLQAAQKQYVSASISCVILILNAFLTVLLVNSGAGLITVKLVSSTVFLLKPLFFYTVVKIEYDIKPKYNKNEKYLKQKWTGFGQHIAYFLHSNTDVALLTLLVNLKTVSVYAVYNMVITHIQSFATAFTSGMEAVFGDMIARGEQTNLKKAFSEYETLISVVGTVMFVCTAVLIVPFVGVYTSGVSDADYHRPVFAMALCISAWLYCLRLPYHSAVIAAGHFKQTRLAAYGETVVNVVLSVLLILLDFGLVGVAVGTVAATLFRFVFYMVYLSKNILKIPVAGMVRRLAFNGVLFGVVASAGCIFTSKFAVNNYFEWLIMAVIVAFAAFLIIFTANLLFYNRDVKNTIEIVLKAKKDN